jgi:folylpolyglutamate synthase/dihydropteroate synthase
VLSDHGWHLALLFLLNFRSDLVNYVLCGYGERCHGRRNTASLARQHVASSTRKTSVERSRLRSARRQGLDGIVGQVSRSFDTWVIGGLQGARALAPEALATRVRDLGANVEAVAADVVAGCLSAEALAQAGDRIVVFGSFLTVGPALGWLYTSRPWSA